MADVNVGGVGIHYEVRGDGPPLVLVMGLGADGTLWEEHVTAYEKHFRCILIDNRGAGLSDTPSGPYTTEMMARDALAVMDHGNVDVARIAGISMGSGIAQHLALIAPERVRCVVLASSWSRCDAYMKAIFEHFSRMRAAAADVAEYMQLVQLWIWTPAYYDEHVEDMLEGQQDAGDNPMPVDAYQAQCQACVAHDTYDRLDRIEAPSFLTVGDSDILTPLWCSREMHERMPASELLVFPGSGHVHHWEDVETFNARTTEFLLAN